MAYIYQIINDINQKIYIGKTEFSIEKRFKEHCRDSQKNNCENRPLYHAMNKYGIDHFHVSLIEETQYPEEREKYWIEQKRSFKNGYNATLGGDGAKYLDYDLVVETYKQVKNCNEVARRLSISADSVSNIVKANGIFLLTGAEVNINKGYIVNQYDLNGNFIQSFPSAIKAGESIKGKGCDKGVASHIISVCKHKRKTAYGYKWEYA